MQHIIGSAALTSSANANSASLEARSGRTVDARTLESVAGLLLMGTCGFAIIYGLDSLAMHGRLSLTVFVGVLVSWVVLRLPDMPVALAGALALVVSGAVEEATLFATLGNEIVWLLIAAFVMASVLRKTGLAERLSVAVLSRCKTVAGAFWAATLVISATAFVIPSTSARAAILLPVFLATSQAIARPAVTKGLALLFPSVILLSACASLTGAGAHMIAADFMKRVGGVEIDFALWAVLGAPFALATSLLACGLIQALFLTSDDRRVAITRPPARDLPRSGNEAAVLAVVGGTVLAWATTGLHGQSVAVVAMIGAMLSATKCVSGVPLKEALKGVEWNLLLFLAATLLIGEALLTSGAARYVIDHALAALRDGLPLGPWTIAFVAALLSSLAHVVITSRTARAGVLIPVLALPLAGLGADPSSLIFLTAIGSGFCQTLMVSAKPLVVFGTTEAPTFAQADLLRLAAWLLPAFIALLVIFAMFVWPEVGLTFAAANPTQGNV